MLNQDKVKIDELREMGHRNTICEAVMNVKDALQIAYPHSTFYIVASDMHLNEKGVPQKYRVATKHGDQKDLSVETTIMSVDTRWLADTCVESALNIIASHQPQGIIAEASARLHDAVLDYAHYMGLSTEGYDYCRDHPKWRDRLNTAPATNDDTTIHRIGQKVTPLALEQHITQVRQELQRLLDMRDPATIHRMVRDEIKRLKRKNEIQAAKLLQDDLDAYDAAQERKRLIHEERMRNLAKAQAVLAEKREKKRRAKQQPGLPNFAKMAKAKRQQIAARQAEKRKKRAAGTGTSQVSSCSQLLNR